MNDIHNEMQIQWYINMYAWCIQRIEQQPSLRAQFLSRAELYQNMYLQVSPPITIDQILSP